MKMFDTLNMLGRVPEPWPQQIRSLNRLVQSVAHDRGLSNAETAEYLATVDELEAFLRDFTDDVRLQAFGPVLSGSALNGSEVTLNVTGNRSAPCVLMQVYRILQRHGGPRYVNVLGNFSDGGCVKVEERDSGRQLLLVIDSHPHVLTSQLLRMYFLADPRAKSLAVMLKSWAQACRLDRPEEGTLPACAFDLLIVYFLQQVRPPVLPVLPLPQNAENAHLPSDVVQTLKSEVEEWRSDNQSCVGELWLQLLKFYCCQFDFTASVVSVRGGIPLTHKDKNWSCKKLAIEDPFCVGQSLAKTMKNHSIVKFFQSSLVRAYEYFGIPRDKRGKPLACLEQHSKAWEKTDGQQAKSNSVEKEDKCPGIKAARTCVKADSASLVKDSVGGSAADIKLPLSERPRHVTTHSQDLSKSEEEEEDVFGYELYIDFFTRGEMPEMVCSGCGNLGHTRANCPETSVPAIQLPTPSPEHLVLVNNVISDILYDFSPQAEDREDRSSLLKKLTTCVQKVFPDACVDVFGSSTNGFGFYSSDMDISVSFKETIEQDPDEASMNRIIKRVARILHASKDFTSVLVIAKAKVPIIKFKHRPTQVEGDISLNNFLGIHNTRLLQCYSSIDQRVQILGLAVKVFAKACEIGNASLGSLSSYAYILMMLHYLQQCQPPVIPVLQELYPKNGKPEPEGYMVRGCNIWFFDDLQRLPEVWPEFGQNKQSVGDLWLGFLRYYVTRFDWRSRVVSIRQAGPLTKFEKRWTNPNIAIEDPFEVKRNLGNNLANWVNACIFHAFRCGAVHFWTSVESNKAVFNKFLPTGISDYFFDVYLLTCGGKASDIYCPACCQSGHCFRDCRTKNLLRGIPSTKKKKKKKRKTAKTQPAQNSQNSSSTTCPPAEGAGSTTVGEAQMSDNGATSSKTEQSSLSGRSTGVNTETSLSGRTTGVNTEASLSGRTTGVNTEASLSGRTTGVNTESSLSGRTTGVNTESSLSGRTTGVNTEASLCGAKRSETIPANLAQPEQTVGEENSASGAIGLSHSQVLANQDCFQNSAIADPQRDSPGEANHQAEGEVGSTLQGEDTERPQYTKDQETGREEQVRAEPLAQVEEDRGSQQLHPSCLPVLSNHFSVRDDSIEHFLGMTVSRVGDGDGVSSQVTSCRPGHGDISDQSELADSPAVGRHSDHALGSASSVVHMRHLSAEETCCLTPILQDSGIHMPMVTGSSAVGDCGEHSRKTPSCFAAGDPADLTREVIDRLNVCSNLSPAMIQSLPVVDDSSDHSPVLPSNLPVGDDSSDHSPVMTSNLPAVDDSGDHSPVMTSNLPVVDDSSDHSPVLPSNLPVGDDSSDHSPVMTSNLPVVDDDSGDHSPVMTSNLPVVDSGDHSPAVTSNLPVVDDSGDHSPAVTSNLPVVDDCGGHLPARTCNLPIGGDSVCEHQSPMVTLSFPVVGGSGDHNG